MRGVAWAAPTVVVTTAAPALAASSPCIEIDLDKGQSAALDWDSGWVESLDPTQFVDGTGNLAGPPTSFRPVGGGACKIGSVVTQTTSKVTNAKIGQRDPKSSSATFSYSRSVCFAPGTYQLTYYANALRANPVTAYMKPSITGPGGPVATSPAGSLVKHVTAYGFVDPTTGTGLYSAYPKSNLERTRFGFQFTVGASGTFTFKLVWSFGAIATDQNNSGLLERAGSNPCLQTYANDIGVEAPVITRTS